MNSETVSNIYTDLENIGYEDMDWIEVAQDIVQLQILLNTMLKLSVPDQRSSLEAE
jgi:hypothetical protein